MQCLLFSDLHRDRQAARNLLQMSRDADVVIGAGDFATTRKGIHDVIDILSAIDRPAVLVPGNSESFDELVAACAEWPAARVLHGTGAEVDGVQFYGLGGAVPETPFGSWSFDLSEEEARALLTNCPSQSVLVSHSPPKGILDQSSRRQSLGSVAVREALDRCQPKLLVCGHIHADSGRQLRVDGTVVINAGPGGVFWELQS